MEIKKLIQLVETMEGADHYRIAAEIAEAQKEDDALFLEELEELDLANQLRSRT